MFFFQNVKYSMQISEMVKKIVNIIWIFEIIAL